MAAFVIKPDQPDHHSRPATSSMAPPANSDVLRLYHELQIHQLELEQQNDELKRAKEEVDAILQERQRIYRALSHDMAQPVLALRLFAGTLLGTSMSSKQRQLVQHIQSLTETLGAISTSVSFLSKDYPGHPIPDRQLVALAPLLGKALDCHLPVAQQKGLRVRLVPTTLHVLTDPTLFIRIVGNIIANAVNFTQTGGVVIGARRARAGGIRIEVWDSGSGIDAEHLPRIYDEFFQTGNPERNPQKGFGLGLAIARRLAEDLGMSLEVASAPGRGSKFSVLIPRSSRYP